MYGAEQKDFIGKKIEAVFVSDDDQLLYLQTGPTEAIKFQAEGDCCSSSYFNDINGISVLLGGTIAKIEDIANARDDIRDSEWGDLTQFYGVKIVTDKGYCDIIYRNESNGYYGGWCESSLAIGIVWSVLTPVTMDGDFSAMHKTTVSS